MRKMASIQTVEEKKAIEGADRIEAVRVEGWWVVTLKDQFQIDDKVVFCEIDSFFTEKFPEIEFLWEKNNPKKMFIDCKEIEGIVLKTCKLKGQISQGLVLPLSVLDGRRFVNDTREKPVYKFNLFQDVSELLNIYKYDKPIPANLAGEVKGNFPGFLPKTDETRIQACMDLLESKKDTLVYLSEKVDGSSASYFKKDGKFGVCSRNLELKETEGNSYWEMAKKYNLKDNLPDNCAIQGEIAGPSIQCNPLKLQEVDLFIFNIWSIKDSKYLDFVDMEKMCQELGLKTVPILQRDVELNHSFDNLMAIADENSLISKSLPKEGIVVRPMKECQAVIGRVLTRFSFKVISNQYLLEEK